MGKKIVRPAVRRPEVLAPAGDMERLEFAVRYGADAVYLAGKEFGMRTASPNFTPEELENAVAFAHENGVRVYLTCNNVLHNRDYDGLPEFFRNAVSAGVDALILTDLGAFQMARKYAPDVEIHVSTQAGVAGYGAANAFYELGAKRVVLARELTLEEIAEIRAKTPKELELETFVHGSMCVSFSGRCLLSQYFTGRDANRGDCAQPCRWKYTLMEETRPGVALPIAQSGNGTYILNSRDLCMAEHIPELIKAGVDSLKIEGRAKSFYYAAVVTNAYRHAVDAFLKNPEEEPEPWILEELGKISHRAYCTGFYLGGEPGQVLKNGGYIRDYEVIAVCAGSRDGMTVLSQRNRFFRGDVADVLEPGRPPYQLPLDEIYDANGVSLENANHAQMTVLLKTAEPIAEGAILRKKLNHD